MSGYGHVAIDGPAGSGKTTVARALAPRLHLLYLDTGAMYRAVALLAIRAGADANCEDAIVALAREQPIHVVHDAATPDGFRVYAGGSALGNELYANEVSRIVSVIAAYPVIRDLMVERQRSIAAEGPVVMAGRDIGTVVLPDAPLKIFLTASVEERVQRRGAELAERGTLLDPQALRAEIEERDRLDRNRSVAPLRPAPDAIEIDSTGMSVDEVVDRIAELACARAGDARR